MPIVTIDGALKAIRTALRADANKEPLVMAQVVVEFELDAEAVGKLARMQDSQIRCQITDAQMELPRAAAK